MHRTRHEQPLPGQQPLVRGQQRTAYGEEVGERATLEQHRVTSQTVLDARAIASGSQYAPCAAAVSVSRELNGPDGPASSRNKLGF